MSIFDLSDGLELRVSGDVILTVMCANEKLWGSDPNLGEILDPSYVYWSSGISLGGIPSTEGLTGAVPTSNGGATVIFRELPDFAHISMSIGPASYDIDSINGGIVITTPTGITQYPLPSVAFAIEFGPTSSRKYQNEVMSEEIPLPMDITGIPISFSASQGVRFLAIDRPYVNIPLIMSAMKYA